MISWNWQPADPIFVDLETQSAANLKKVGAAAYLRHRSTRLMSAVFLYDGTYYVFIPPGVVSAEARSEISRLRGDCPIEFGECDIAGKTLIAHNAETFDGPAWERFGYETGVTWYDTLHKCRAGGLPGGLDKAAKALGHEGKKSGDAMRALCVARPLGDGRYSYPVGTPEQWREMVEYNIQDVRALQHVYEGTRQYGDPRFLEAHCKINAAGIPVSVEFAFILAQLWDMHERRAKERVAATTTLTGDDLRSPAKVKRYLREECGLDLATLNRAIVESEMHDFPEKARMVVEARMDAIRANKGKISRLIEIVDDDGRIRNCFISNGAHTGRFSARGLQPHNFSRPVAGVDVDALVEDIMCLLS